MSNSKFTCYKVAAFVTDDIDQDHLWSPSVNQQPNFGCWFTDGIFSWGPCDAA